MENSYRLAKEIFDKSKSFYDQQEKLYEMLAPLADLEALMLQEIKVEQQAYKENDASISLFIEPAQTSCGHLFNRIEIVEWLIRSSNQSCPVCHASLSLKELITV